MANSESDFTKEAACKEAIQCSHVDADHRSLLQFQDNRQRPIGRRAGLKGSVAGSCGMAGFVMLPPLAVALAHAQAGNFCDNLKGVQLIAEQSGRLWLMIVVFRPFPPPIKTLAALLLLGSTILRVSIKFACGEDRMLDASIPGFADDYKDKYTLPIEIVLVAPTPPSSDWQDIWENVKRWWRGWVGPDYAVASPSSNSMGCSLAAASHNPGINFPPRSCHAWNTARETC